MEPTRLETYATEALGYFDAVGGVAMSVLAYEPVRKILEIPERIGYEKLLGPCVLLIGLGISYLSRKNRQLYDDREKLFHQAEERRALEDRVD